MQMLKTKMKVVSTPNLPPGAKAVSTHDASAVLQALGGVG